MKKKQITLVDDVSGDWMGLYIDGQLVAENHSLDVDDVLTLCGVEFTKIESDVDQGGRLPPRVEDVPRP